MTNHDFDKDLCAAVKKLLNDDRLINAIDTRNWYDFEQILSEIRSRKVVSGGMTVTYTYDTMLQVLLELLWGENIPTPGLMKSIKSHFFLGSPKVSNKTVLNVSVGIETLNSYSFAFSNYTEINLPYTVKVIRTGAFKECKNLEKITLGSDVELLESKAFEDCTNLKHIELPKSLKFIGSDVFIGCSSLKKIDFMGNKKQFDELFGKSNPLGYLDQVINVECSDWRGTYV